MMRRAVRLTLVMVFIAAMGATAYLFWEAERQAQVAESAVRRFDDDARAAAVEVADLRAAQQAYVAAGQGADFWFARTTTFLADLKARVAALKSESASPDARASLDDALGVLQDFEQMDLRAREFARAHQTTVVSDLIFSDGLELSRRLNDAIELARAAEVATRDADQSALRRRELFSLGAAAAASTLMVLLLVPTGRMPEETGATFLTPAHATDLMADAPVDDTAGDLRLSPATAAPAAAPLPSPSAAVDLPGVAALCGELARVVDSRALPAMFERAAALLDASGIILWIADPDGRELAPIMAHGYAPNLLTRLGSIQRDAENVTAAAYRTGLLQTVRADAVSHGAIAAPVVAAVGCVGVMAAEIRHDGEQQESKLAAASIIAAQLATLVGPPAARVASSKTEAAGMSAI